MRALFLLMLLASPAFGANDSDRASAWIVQFLKGNEAMDYLGVTLENGRPCGLYLTDKSKMGGTLWVAVGFHGSSNLNDYAGVIDKASDIEFKTNQIIFRSRQPWGNKSTWNTVTVDLNAKLEPVRAKGESSLISITCVIAAKGDPQTVSSL